MQRIDWKRRLLVVAAASSLALPLATFTRRAMAADAPPAAEKKVQKSELHSEMEDMDDDFKKLKRTVRKAEQNAESLKLISAIQARAVKSKEMIPTKAQKLPDAERAKFVAAYRKEMAAVLIDFCQMEQAILDGDNTKAQDIYKAVVEREDKDHDVYMQKEEKKK